MADLYKRKLRPNKKHIIAALLLVIGLILFHIGSVRFGRVTARRDPSMYTGGFEDREAGKNMFSALAPLRLATKDGVQQRDVCFMTDIGFLKDINVYASAWGRDHYMFIAVEANSKEEREMLEGEKVTCYFSGKYTDELKEFLAHVNDYYDTSNLTDAQKYLYGDIGDGNARNRTTLGVIVVNREKEKRSWLYCLPFLLLGIIILKKAGEPFLYIPVEENE